jgi:hypothetical protein
MTYPQRYLRQNLAPLLFIGKAHLRLLDVITSLENLNETGHLGDVAVIFYVHGTEFFLS